MPKVQVVSILDDRDGKPLPDDVEPIDLALEGVRWRLYLSDENKEELRSFIADFTKDAEPAATFRPTGAAPAGTGVGPEERKALMTWSRTQNGMKAVAERGRIADSVLKAWNEAGKPGFSQ
jgi:hypothetical protein